jgi:hypothetical protein
VALSAAETQLLALLREIFADNVVTAEERQDLIELQAGLRPGRAERVLLQFVAEKWGEVIADGIVTAEEKLILRRVLEELQLPDDSVPAEVRAVLG